MFPFIAHYPSPLGTLELSANEQTLQAVLFRDAEKRIGLGQEITGERSAIIDLTIRQLDEYFSGKRQIFELPMAQNGTDFQQRVWSGLLHIPYGETISYLELARRLGDEKCIRAAGMANGKNNLAILVPCHRVIGSQGQLIGYGGELWRKAWLLRHERAFGPKRVGELF